MSWTIRIPYRSRDESLVAVASHARTLGQDDDRKVCRQLVLDWATSGVRTVSDALDRLAGMTPAERRDLLDRTRKAAGLPGIEDVERQQWIETQVTRVHLDPGLQHCHATNCQTIPTTETGSWALVRCRKWFCAAHEHLAAPGDLDDLGSGLRYSESGAIVPIDPAAEARERAAEESRRRQREHEAAERAAEAEAVREHERGKRAQLRAELPDHLKDTA